MQTQRWCVEQDHGPHLYDWVADTLMEPGTDCKICPEEKERKYEYQTVFAGNMNKLLYETK